MAQKSFRIKPGTSIYEWFENQNHYSESLRILINAAIQVYGKGDLVDAISQQMSNHFASQLSQLKDTSNQANTRQSIQGRDENKNKQNLEDKLEEKQEKEVNDNKPDPLDFLSS